MELLHPDNNGPQFIIQTIPVGRKGIGYIDIRAFIHFYFDVLGGGRSMCIAGNGRPF